MNTTRQKQISPVRDGPSATGVAAHHRHLDCLRAGEHHGLFCALDELRDAGGGQPGGGGRGRAGDRRRGAVYRLRVVQSGCPRLHAGPVNVFMQGGSGGQRAFLADRARVERPGSADDGALRAGGRGVQDECQLRQQQHVREHALLSTQRGPDHHRLDSGVAKHQHLAAEWRGGISHLHGFAAAVSVQELEVRDR